MALQERYVATDGDNTDAQATYDAATSLANACSIAVAVKYAVAGDRVNVKNGNKAGTKADYDLSGANLSHSANDGTAAAGPIIFRGYNSAIGDLEAVGRPGAGDALDTSNFPVFALATRQWITTGSDYILIQNIKATCDRNGRLFEGSAGMIMHRCCLENASTATSYCLANAAVNTRFIDCDFNLTGASGGAACAYLTTATGVFAYCRFTGQAKGILTTGDRTGFAVIGCVFKTTGTAIDIGSVTSTAPQWWIIDNTIHGVVSAPGILLGNGAVLLGALIFNNHITDCGTYGIDCQYAGTGAQAAVLVNNRTRNNSSGALNGFGDWPTINHITTGTLPSVDFIEVMTIDVEPTTDWAKGDVITGQTSASTCTVVAKLTDTTYSVAGRNGAFTVGEIIGVTGNADKLADQGAAHPTFTVTDFDLVMTAPGKGTASMPYRDVGAVQRNVRASDHGLTAAILKDGETVDDVTGTLEAPTPGEIAAAMWDDDTSPDRTVTA